MKYVAYPLPGAPAWTTCVFSAAEVPNGTPILPLTLTDAQLDRAVEVWFETFTPGVAEVSEGFRTRMKAALETLAKEAL